MWYKFSQQILPPVHDRCHCYIQTMPAGNQIWQFSDKCCDQCKALAIDFNKKQDTIVNEPAQLNPPSPIGPSEENPQMGTQQLRYVPKKFY